MRSLIVFASLFWLLPAVAAIDSVTVYPDRAVVTRIVELNLDAGAGQLVEEGLPVSLTSESLRISARGADGLRLGAYRLERQRGSERASERARELEQQLQALRDDRDLITDGLQARELELGLLQSVVAGSGGGDQRLSPSDIEQAMSSVGKGADAVLAERRSLLLQQRELDQNINRLQRELDSLGQNELDTQTLIVELNSERAGKARFEIEYVITGAAWRPVYEWRLDTESQQLELTQFAEVRQRSGEDWSEAILNLSLARPAMGGRLPALYSWWVDVWEEREALHAMEAAQAAPPTTRARPAVTADSAAGTSAAWNTAQLSGSEYNRSWQLPGQVSVASNNQPHRFRLEGHVLDTRLTARTVPARQAGAWLFASAEWNADYALPPGPVTLYQDNVLIGQNQFTGLAPGKALEASFGLDENITVEWDLVEDERAREGVLRKSVVLTRAHRLRIINGHSQPIDLVIHDAMPVSRDERISVTRITGMPAPTTTDVNDMPGVQAWERSLRAGQTLEMKLGYIVKYPEDLERVTGW